MVSFEPPILMFSGTKGNTTEKNILESNCFGVNCVDSSMASKVFECIQQFGKERIDKTGFTLIEASKINAPLVHECKAHLECRLHSTLEVGSGFVVFGEVVHASIWEEILQVEYEKRYELLDQIVFLEDSIFSSITKTAKASGVEMNMKKDKFIRYVILLTKTGKSMTEELIRAHVAHLKELDKKGQLVLCGPYLDYKGGVVIIKAESFDEAKAIAESDPFVKAGAETYELRTLELSCKENNHLGMG